MLNEYLFPTHFRVGLELAPFPQMRSVAVESLGQIPRPLVIMNCQFLKGLYKGPSFIVKL
jgi:hypothetical protein